jgi:uncharacterized membrane protein
MKVISSHRGVTEQARETMNRKVFDKLASVGGVLMVVVLAVAGALLLVGANFANNNVRTQLAEQHITFPSAAVFAHPNGTEITKSMTPTVSQYAGQQLTTGAQAEVYANDFIAVHLSQMPYHGNYAAISTASRQDPSNAKLAALVQTSFQGTTLRGLLLEAYAFSVFGEIAIWGAIAAFVIAGLMAVLVLLGIAHARRTNEATELFTRTVHTPATAAA